MSMTTPTNGSGSQSPQPLPNLEEEKGTIFDYYATGELLFGEVPGLPKGTGLVWDYDEPTVLQLREMLKRDGKAKSLEAVLVMPIVGSDWRLEAEGAQAQDIASSIENMLRRTTLDGGMETPMHDVIAQKAEALVFRRSYHEKVWKMTDDNQVTYKKVAWRPPSTCELARDKLHGDLRGFTQWVPEQVDRQVILLPYADVFIHGKRRDPNKGTTELEVPYWNYRMKEKLKFLWFTYCEVLSLPRQVVLANSGGYAQKAAEAIASLKNAGVVGMPAEWVKQIVPIEISGQGSEEFQNAIGYLDSDSALSILAGFTELPSRAVGSGAQMGPVGSYALAESATDFYMDAIQGYADELSSNITTNLIADLVRYNYGFKAPIPKFVIDLQQEVVQRAFNLLAALITAPQINVPLEFVQQLTLAVARQLGMNVTEIQGAMQRQTQQAQAAAQTVQQAANAPLQAATNVGAAVAAQARQAAAP